MRWRAVCARCTLQCRLVGDIRLAVLRATGSGCLLLCIATTFVGLTRPSASRVLPPAGSALLLLSMAGHLIIGFRFVSRLLFSCCVGAVPADGGELNVNLQKMKKADTWPSALQGRNTRVDPMTLEGMQKKIMLERFQSEVCVCMYV